MVDEVKVQCFGCNKWGFIMVFDPDMGIHFCPECCAELGHEPPFSWNELLELTKSKKGV